MRTGGVVIALPQSRRIRARWTCGILTKERPYRKRRKKLSADDHHSLTSILSARKLCEVLVWFDLLRFVNEEYNCFYDCVINKFFFFFW